MNEYTTIIGLEIHVELKTKSKMFCGCKNDPFFAKQPNSYTCPVCLGMPGGLPVPNRKAVEWTILLGLALGCEIPLLSKFDRKNYFYPDLPKGYQISQYDMPLAVNGKITINGRQIGIRRVHLEEDTGKLLHSNVEGKKVTLVDFNRSGIPLVEIVTEPDIRSAEEAKAFLKKLHQIIRYLEISDADMEKGSMRLEPNISVRKASSKGLPNYKVEVKNINSFNFVKRAIEFEKNRQIQILERGKTPQQETRGWNEGKGETYTLRLKETADDYRYFPEPDIPPLRWIRDDIEKLRKILPEMPEVKKERFMKKYSLSEQDAALLTDTPGIASYFEECVRVADTLRQKISPKHIANWLINRNIDTESEMPASLVQRIFSSLQPVDVSEGTLASAIGRVMKEHPKAVSDYRQGKTQALMFLVGQVKKYLANSDTKIVIQALKKHL